MGKAAIFCFEFVLLIESKPIFSCSQEDAPLADEGIEEAKEAGRLLKLHGFEFDVVYTSWLSRALETAWYVMDEMDALWLPIIKTWRLNERMYGGLVRNEDEIDFSRLCVMGFPNNDLNRRGYRNKW